MPIRVDGLLSQDAHETLVEHGEAVRLAKKLLETRTALGRLETHAAELRRELEASRDERDAQSARQAELSVERDQALVRLRAAEEELDARTPRLQRAERELQALLATRLWRLWCACEAALRAVSRPFERVRRSKPGAGAAGRGPVSDAAR